MNDANIIPDKRAEDLQRLTSHLKDFKIPEAEQHGDDVLEFEPLALPHDVPKVLQLLKDAQALPAGTRTELAIRHNKVNQITAHLHAIQQGKAAPLLTVEHLKNFQPATCTARRTQIERICREYPVFAKLAGEIKPL